MVVIVVVSMTVVAIMIVIMMVVSIVIMIVTLALLGAKTLGRIVQLVRRCPIVRCVDCRTKDPDIRV
jgi:hypothetical protein